jgi:hypothetical protein
MCVSCGCGEGFDDHGNNDNITAASKVDDVTEEQLVKAADAQGLSVEEGCLWRRSVAISRRRPRRPGRKPDRSRRPERIAR